MVRQLDSEDNKNTESRAGYEPVSILIIVKNELKNLQELIPVLMHQKFKVPYDIHLIDDHSDEDIPQWITSLSEKKIIYHRVPDSIPEGKKRAFQYALSLETHEIWLLTDADCTPASDEWIQSMYDRLDAHAAVLGYSPYTVTRGWLNKVIQLETIYTAMLYFSYAIRGTAYMGVGRNILYRKKAFLQLNALRKYDHLLSGDDDLSINELARNQTIGIQLDPESFMISAPKSSFAEWVHQKKRHVSTAKYYRVNHQISLALFYFSLIMSWVGVFYSLFVFPKFLILFLLCKLMNFFSFNHISRKRMHHSWYFLDWLIAEVIYICTLIYISPFTMIKKVKKW